MWKKKSGYESRWSWLAKANVEHLKKYRVEKKMLQFCKVLKSGSNCSSRSNLG